MKNDFKRCLVYRMYALTAVLTISLTISAPNPNQAQYNCCDKHEFEISEAQEKRQCISYPRQISEKQENGDTLISIPEVSEPQTPDALDSTSANNGNRYDPPLLETQTPITVEYCVTGYDPASDSSVMDTLTAPSTSEFKPPVQFSEFYPKDKLHEPTKAIYIASVHIDKYIKEVVSIPNNQRSIYPFII